MSLTLNLQGLSMRGNGKDGKVSFTEQEKSAAKQVVGRVLLAAGIVCDKVDCTEAVEIAIVKGMNNPKNKDKSLSGICRHGLKVFIEESAEAGTEGFPKGDRDYGSLLLMLRTAATDLKVNKEVINKMFPSYYSKKDEKKSA